MIIVVVTLVVCAAYAPRAQPASDIVSLGTTAVTPEQFGAVGDCTHDDTIALLAMRDYLRGIQDARALRIHFIVNFGAGKCYKYNDNRWTWGLKDLSLIGNGAALQNVYPAIGSARGPGGAYPLITNRDGLSSTSLMHVAKWTNPLGPLINEARIGDTKVITKVESEANGRVFKKGLWALVQSYNQQLDGGWPPNARYFDFVKIVGVDPAGGVIFLDRALEHNHSDSYPTINDSDRVGGTAGLGPARISILGDDEFPFSELLYMENLTILDNPNAGRLGDKDDYPGDRAAFHSHQYLLVAGVYRAVLKNITGGTFIPSVAHSVEVYGSHFWEIEVDKLLERVEFTNTMLDHLLSGCTGADVVRFTGGSITTRSYVRDAVDCPARKFYMDGVTLSSPNLSANKNRVTLSLNVSFPASVTVKNSTFTGGGGDSRPVGGPGTVLLLLDGSSNTSLDGNQIVMRDLGTNTAARRLLRCTAVGANIGILKSGQSAELMGTITGITGDGRDAKIGIRIKDRIEVGDRVVCHSYAVGSVTLTNNIYRNYGGPPEPP